MIRLRIGLNKKSETENKLINKVADRESEVIRNIVQGLKSGKLNVLN